MNETRSHAAEVQIALLLHSLGRSVLTRFGLVLFWSLHFFPLAASAALWRVLEMREQYWWLHKRFKTRRPGEPRPY